MLDAALAVVDAEGLAALNARDLATRLGVSAATPYRYFDNRERLVDAMVEHAMPSPAEDEGADRPWQEQLADCAREIHADLVRHPGVLEILMTRPLGEPILDPWRERIFGILRTAGFDARRTAEAASMLTSLVYGSVIMESFRARERPDDERARIAALPREDFPVLAEVADSYVRYHAQPETFEFALTTLIAAL